MVLIVIMAIDASSYEGEFFAFDYCTDRMENEGSDGALALLRVKDGRLEEVFNPEDAAGLFGVAGSEESLKALSLLRQKGITRVYTLYPSNPQGEVLFGFKLGFEEEKDIPEGDPTPDYTHDFVEYTGLFGDYWSSRFAEFGLELCLFDEA